MDNTNQNSHKQKQNDKEDQQLKQEVNQLLTHGRRAWYADFWNDKNSSS
ncbi:hypothetical protein [Peribacillus sp. SCS-155]